jgi:sugar transferase (PEP-CTERM/EpsH1 system associated)
MKTGSSKPDHITIGHVIYAFHDGGMERGLLNLINYGDRDHFHHVILCLTDAGAFAKLLASPTCTVVELRKREGNDWRLPWRIARVARQRTFDVLHARGWPTLVETAIAARLAKVSATVYGFHGKTFDDLQGIGFKRRWLQKVGIRSYKNIVTLSPRLRSEFAAECGIKEEKIRLIANGVDVQKFRPCDDQDALRSRFGIPLNRFIVGNVARLDPVKNHEIFMRVLERLKKRADCPFFLVVGEGSHRAALEAEAARLELGAHIRLFGYSEHIAELLNCMDLYVQPSLYEGFSNTILESMACGLPVLATDVGGSADLFSAGQEGFFFRPEDDETLTSLIVQLQHNAPLRYGMGRRARSRAVEHFSICRTVCQYEVMYAELIEASFKSH